MTKHGMRVVHLTMALLALWIVIPAVASAQVTVSQVRVTIGGSIPLAVYCDAFTSSLDGTCQNVWTFPGVSHSFTLAPTETLVLTQTGISPGSVNFGNFDTSDRVHGTFLSDCAGNCTVKVELNTGAGLVTVHTSGAGVGNGDPLDNYNNEDGTLSHAEGHAYVQVHAESSYTLSLGYADNVHSTVFFPSPFGTATHFLGAGLGQEGNCPINCYDAGVLLITGLQVPSGHLTTITQGGWGAPAHGNNPGTILNANFPTVYPFGVIIGSNTAGCFKLSFTSSTAVRNFLPQGGPPAKLTASGTNVTTSSAGVFAGQVLALQINVNFSSAGVLPVGLGSFVLPSGPAAGKTVNQVLADANAALGCGTLPSYVSSISGLNDIVDSINNLFD